MKESTLPPRFLLDAGVPDSVADALKQAKFEVILHREVLLERTPDDVVAITALQNSATLVAIDRDMKHLARRYGQKLETDRFKRLNLMVLACSEALAATRVTNAISLIQSEWDFAVAKQARRLWLEIRPHSIITHR